MAFSNRIELSKTGAGAPPVAPPQHAFERERLESLRRLKPFSQGGEVLAAIACQVRETCLAAIGMVSLMEESEQRVLACAGAEIVRMERSVSFCAFTILEATPIAVADTLADPRFRNNPYVTGDPYVRYYIGAPILDGSGLPLGSVCAFGFAPNEISSRCLFDIQTLAERTSAVLEARRLVAEAHGRNADDKDLEKSLSRLDSLLLPLVDHKIVRGCSAVFG